jgi:hypothetical protein
VRDATPDVAAPGAPPDDRQRRVGVSGLEGALETRLPETILGG